MINIHDIYHIEKVISNELSRNMKTNYGSWEYSQLLKIKGMVDVLINHLEKQ